MEKRAIDTLNWLFLPYVMEEIIVAMGRQPDVGDLLDFNSLCLFLILLVILWMDVEGTWIERERKRLGWMVMRDEQDGLG